MPDSTPAYRRVVIKISGEGLGGEGGVGINPDALNRLAEELQPVHQARVQAAIVVGAGNLIRGAVLSRSASIPEATAHHMGMLATVINALALQEVLEAKGIPARVMSSIAIASICEHYAHRTCIEHLEQGRLVILGGGTGRPFVTTDSAAALAAAELRADALLKGTQVDGVYSADPRRDRRAEFYPRLAYDRVLSERLEVMDFGAVDMCRRQHIPIVVFNLHTPGNLKRIIDGEQVGTVVTA
jgi:uridylate kinase